MRRYRGVVHSEKTTPAAEVRLRPIKTLVNQRRPIVSPGIEGGQQDNPRFEDGRTKVARELRAANLNISAQIACGLRSDNALVARVTSNIPLVLAFDILSLAWWSDSSTSVVSPKIFEQRYLLQFPVFLLLAG